MSKPMITIHNVETGEIFDREMTQAEILSANEEYLATQAAEAARKAEADALAAKKAEVLQRLGITEDEAKALLA